MQLLRPTLGEPGPTGPRLRHRPGPTRSSSWADHCVPEDVADAVTAYVREEPPWALLAPSTAFGREVAARVAAATGSGLVGDAVSLHVHDGALVAGKPAFAGALVADITCRTPTQMVTVRPGVLPAAGDVGSRRGIAATPPWRREVGTRGRVRILGERRNDDVETLARAQVVIGVGTGVAPDEYEELSPLAALLGRRAGGDPQGHRQGLGPPGPAGRHHGPLDRATALRRAWR